MVANESEILRQLKLGDKQAYERLFQQHYRNLVLYAKKFVLETEIARDLVQDVFFYVWEKREKLSVDKSMSSYLFRAVHNACINHLKRESTKSNYLKNFLLNLNEGAIASHKSQDVHELFVHKDLSERIDAVIDDLPEQCRNIFRLSRYRGLKNKEIAEIYSISPRTVETQIYRALKVLKENLRPYISRTASILIFLVSSIKSL